MPSLVLDQSPSELRLHRALYVVKYLRAMALNLIMVVVAAVLFLVARLDQVYFAANFTWMKEQAQQESGPFLIVGLMAIVGGFILFVWMYLSIVNVWRIALRFQVVWCLLSIVTAPLWLWPPLRFSFQNLSPLFTAIVVLSYALIIVFVSDMAIALWRVSGSPERTSFVATLDRRLVRNSWAFVNKLVDLPRTPFRNWRTAAAYVLSFCGTILQIASILYVISFGAASNKLGQLFLSCSSKNMVACSLQSSIWSRHILLWFGLALIVGLPGAAVMQSAAKRLGGLSVSDVLEGSDERYILYLRPFDMDDVILPRPRLPLLSKLVSFRPFPVRIEEQLFDVADGYRPLIAVGKPTGHHSQEGRLAYRDYLDDTNWQNYILGRIRLADSIVVVLKNSGGLRWELSQILEEGATSKTLFLFPPEAKAAERWQNLAKEVLPAMEFQSRPLGFYFDNGRLIEIENSNWTATSYRTAFSYFLSERQSSTAYSRG